MEFFLPQNTDTVICSKMRILEMGILEMGILEMRILEMGILGNQVNVQPSLHENN